MAPAGEKCHDCDDGEPIRERAYIGGGHAGRKTIGVLELTEKAGAELAEIAKTTNLLGRVVNFGRANNKKNGSITIEVTDQIVSIDKAKHFDTIAALCATWGIVVPGQQLLDDVRVNGDFRADTFKQKSA
jgi:hypothetical protein